MKSRFSRGFTLIELLVVIAIIGILSAVVLASLNTARTRGNDASVKANINGIRTQAEMYYGTNANKYATAVAAGVNCGTTFTTNTMLADPTITKALQAAYKANGSAAFYCNLDAGGTSYAIAAPLATAGTYWCVDSTGSAKSTQGSGSTGYTALSGAATAALTDNADYTCN
ncbi:MAG: type II secretion system protein [Candidatus Paceibacterota bacterium]|jgi:prepilin-type N-terminal cleavage/methylation domain-containing protein